MAQPLTEIPVPPDMPAAVRVVSGGCAITGKRFRRWAHAHNVKSREGFGTICFLGASRVYNPSGLPSAVFWHEYAHLLTPGHGHDDAWRKAMRSLGQRIPTRYSGKS